jgi:hypothetical protein
VISQYVGKYWLEPGNRIIRTDNRFSQAVFADQHRIAD